MCQVRFFNLYFYNLSCFHTVAQFCALSCAIFFLLTYVEQYYDSVYGYKAHSSIGLQWEYFSVLILSTTAQACLSPIHRVDSSDAYRYDCFNLKAHVIHIYILVNDFSNKFKHNYFCCVLCFCKLELQQLGTLVI